jgi:hypothetical protein
MLLYIFGTQLIFSLFFTYLYLELRLPIAYRQLYRHRHLLGCLSPNHPSSTSLHPHTSVIDNRSSTIVIINDYRLPTIDPRRCLYTLSTRYRPRIARSRTRTCITSTQTKKPKPLVKELLDRYRYLTRPFGISSSDLSDQS